MNIKKQLARSFYMTLSCDNFGAYATRVDRRQILMSVAKELVELGYKIPSVQQLKRKHVVALTENWQKKNLGNGTIKNRVAALRHLAVLINKPEIIPSNADLKIGRRRSIAVKNRAIFNPDLTGITNKGVRISLELQRCFGLRREESLKIKPIAADHGGKLVLLGSWCKGNRPREIPIRTQEQRYWLNEAKQFVKRADQSLIPADKSYIRHRYFYDKQLQKIGIRSHSLRHGYAQQRYKELTGWDAPIAGGPQRNALDAAQRHQDTLARMILSEELGHSRVVIIRNYCG
jgi:site-specific recombinase XerC